MRQNPATTQRSEDGADAGMAGVRELLSRLPEGAERTRVAAFRWLRRGEAPGPEQLARDSGLPTSEVDRHLAAMAAMGMVRLDGSGRVIASDGLSLEPTRHRLVLDGVVLHTWCAIDVVGIPPALGADAVASTPCAHCGRLLELRFNRGEFGADHALVAWAPGFTCSNVIEEFCPDANLFCSRVHLEAWRTKAGHPVGKILTLAQVVEQGRRVWGPLRGDR